MYALPKTSVDNIVFLFQHNSSQHYNNPTFKISHKNATASKRAIHVHRIQDVSCSQICKSMPIPKKRRRFSIIDANYPLPLLEFQNMDQYLLSSKDAPRWRAVFLVGKLYANASNRVFLQVTPQRLMTMGTEKVVGIHRAQIGRRPYENGLAYWFCKETEY